jgi:APA family basic amino acid/polyamine antiporter
MEEHMPGDTAGQPSSPRLVRSLTLIPTTSVIIANIIGTGVFLKARAMTCNVETPGMVLLVWILAGILSLAGALVYAELATMMPRAGGEYNFIGAAYGRLPAFLYGWTRSLVGGAANAAIAIVCVIFLNDLLGGTLSPLMQRLLPVAAIVLAMVLNLTSARANGAVATTLSVGKVALVLGIGVGAFVFANGSVEHFSMAGAGGACEGVPESARGGVAGFGAAMLGALWAYNGWNSVTAVGGEVKDPSWTLPRAIVGGTALVIVLYLIINSGYFYALSPDEVASVPESASVAREVAGRFLGAGAAAVISAGLMISAYGTLHAGLLTGPRLPFALARSRLLPGLFGRLSRRGVPVNAVVILGLWSIALTLSGTFDQLTDMYIFVLWVFYAMNVLALFVLRRRHPDADRPHRVWGYPVIPALFLLVTAYLLVNTFVATPGRAVAGAVVLASGLPVYAIFGRRPGKYREDDWLGEGED